MTTGTEEDCEKSQAGYPVFGSRLNSGSLESEVGLLTATQGDRVGDGRIILRLLLEK